MSAERLVVDVVVDDLAFFQCDAIARPATARLEAPTPLIRRLEASGGPKLAAQLRVVEPLAVGSAVVTGAGELDAELMIHGVVLSDTERVTADGVRRALRGTLQRAVDWQLATVALAPYGLGAGNLDPETSAAVLADALEAHQRTRADHPVRLVVVTETADEAEIFALTLSHRGL